MTDPKRILLVEDNADIRMLLELRLKSKGFAVDAAESGMAALAVVKTTLPDLVILDVMMPEMDGYEVCQVLRRDPRTRHLPVIMLSAKTMEADKRRGEMAGATAYLTKPMDTAILMDTIWKLLKSPA